MQSSEAPVLTVSELTVQIKRTLETGYPHVWVQGEVSNFRRQESSGHLYFTLKDAKAQISAIMFRGDAAILRQIPKDGEQLIVRGELNLYERGGKYQIVVRTLRLAGIGELLQKLEELKVKIHKKGWFKSEHKKPLPHLPKRIGVVTSPTGAAIQDILNVLTRRFSGFHLILNPVRVQGESAGKEIAQAIEQFNRFELADVLIVGRGGGSIEDLWAFNEECVAEAIFNSKIPIVSAVGHETDHCIADYVADVRAPTPSAAAEMVMAEKEGLSRQLEQKRRRLDQTMVQQLRHRKAQLAMAQRQPLIASPLRLVEPWLQKIDELREEAEQLIWDAMEERRQQLRNRALQLHAFKPTVRLSHFRQQLAGCRQQLATLLNAAMREKRERLLQRFASLCQAWRHKRQEERSRFNAPLMAERAMQRTARSLAYKKERFERVEQALSTANPKALLARGYSILFSEKGRSVISSVQKLAIGDSYRLMLSDGQAAVTVKELHEQERRERDQL